MPTRPDDPALPEPLVSVVIPTHLSHPPFLSETLASVIAQEWTNWEVIVVDDGSPDPEALARLVNIDDRVRLVRQRPGGVAQARNLGLQEAAGQFVAFLDHDDLWYPHHLSTTTAALAGRADAVGAFTAFDVVAGAAKEHVGVRRIEGATTRHSVLSGGNRPSTTTLVARREAVQAVGGFDTAFEGADDLALVYRLVEVGSYVYVDEVTVAYRLHDNNWSRDNRAMALAGDRFLADHEARLDSAGDAEGAAGVVTARASARRYYAGAAFRQAVGVAKSRQVGRAADLAWWAVRFSPSGAAAMAVGGPLRRLRSLARPPQPPHKQGE